MGDYFQQIGEVIGLKCWKLCDLTDNVHLDDVISNKYEYLKARGMVSMEYDVDIKSYILRISLGKFLKETIEIQPLESELNVSKHFLRNIEV